MVFVLKEVDYTERFHSLLSVNPFASQEETRNPKEEKKGRGTKLDGFSRTNGMLFHELYTNKQVPNFS